MSISGIGGSSIDAVEQFEAQGSTIEAGSSEKVAGASTAAIVKGKTDVCVGDSCVIIDAGETGLTKGQLAAISDAFRDFIVQNPGADLTRSGTTVLGSARGSSESDQEFARVVAQFVGYNLPKGWNGDQVRTVIYVGSAAELQMPASTAGKLDRSWVKDRNPQTEYTLRLNMSWKDHATNPSGLARTMIHEYLHRKDEMGFTGGRRVTEEHRSLDEKARNLLADYGLAGGGCQSVGDSILPWIAPAYPGCAGK